MKRILKFLCMVCLMTATALPARAANLPSGYTELEYLESTGTQYIDTGVSGFNTGTWEVYAKWMITTQTQNASYPNVFSVYNGEDYNSYRVINKLQDSTSYYVSGNSKAGGGSTLVSDIAINQIHEATARNGSVTIDGVVYNTPTQGSTLPADKTMGIFARGDGGSKIQARIYSAWATKNGVLQYNLVPAKYVSGNTTTYGMYDTVRDTFLTNAGTGTFTPGPATCRNLYNKANGVLYGYPSQSFVWQQRAGPTEELSIMLKLTEGETYTVQRVAGAGTSAFRIQASSTETLTQGQQLVNIRSNSSANVQTFTVPNGAPYVIFYVRNVYNANGAPNSSSLTLDQVIDGFQVEQGSTATDYAPYCVVNNEIKIATTKYTEDAFAGLMTTLSEAITKVTNIVDTTVQQATEIGNLATTKQDRPDTDCPAGRKCLLIMGADNKPHWYLIQE